MKHRKLGREEAHGFQRTIGSRIVGGNEHHEVFSPPRCLDYDKCVVAVWRARDSQAAFVARDCCKPLHQDQDP